MDNEAATPGYDNCDSVVPSDIGDGEVRQYVRRRNDERRAEPGLVAAAAKSEKSRNLKGDRRGSFLVPVVFCADHGIVAGTRLRARRSSHQSSLRNPNIL